MKKALLIASLLAAIMVVGVAQATAQEQITVTVTIPSVLSVTLDPGPSAWAIGSVALGDTADTGTNYFTATNNGNVTEDFSIVSSGSVMPGPTAGWTCGETAASETFEMKATGGDLISATSIHTSQTLETDLVKTTGTVTFDLQFTAPTDTAYLDVQHTITVTVTASAT